MRKHCSISECFIYFQNVCAVAQTSGLQHSKQHSLKKDKYDQVKSDNWFGGLWQREIQVLVLP